MSQTKRKKSLYLHVIIFSSLIITITIVVVLFSRLDTPIKSYESTCTVMDLSFEQTVYGEDGQQIADKTVLKVKELLSRVSWKDPESEIYEINDLAGKSWVDVNDENLSILSECIDMADRTNGAFAPTMLPLNSLWDSYKEKVSFPSYDEILRAKDLIGITNLKINQDVKRVKLFKENASISLDDIFTGLACEASIETYRENHANAGVVSFGNDIGVYGTKKNNKPWNIALKDPFEIDVNLPGFAVLKITKGFLSTLSKVENSFEMNGTTYNSVIDPATGYPVDTDLESVTVWHEKGAIADMLARASFILGKDKSKNILDHYGAKAIFVDSNRNVFFSRSLESTFLLNDTAYSIKERF